MPRSCVVLVLAVVALAASPRTPSDADPYVAHAAADSAGFRPALPGYRFRFPRDHASHPEYQTEWWYYTGHLAAGVRRFGYELTFFRVGLDPARRPGTSAWTRHTV